MPLAFLPARLPLGYLGGLAGSALPPPDSLQIHPQYRVRLGIDDVLRKVVAGSDDFLNEKYQDEIAAILDSWSGQLLAAPRDITAMRSAMSAEFTGFSAKSALLSEIASSGPFRVWTAKYPDEAKLIRGLFLLELSESLGSFSRLRTAEMQVVRIRSSAVGASLKISVVVRFEFVGEGPGFHREQRIGNWEMDWRRSTSANLTLERWSTAEETRSRSQSLVFLDASSYAFGRIPSYSAQFLRGIDYWRTVIDGASGIDIYGHNGVAAGDIDNDGFDDLYICQPAGLPNRLFHNRGDGTFEDVTESAGVGVLENSACALFADVNNDGWQDLIVVRATGPLLFLNQGGGKFTLKPDAFRFANAPEGTFTGAAIADYDRDGWLDIYFCLYSYYQGLDQYRYPMPYYDAENGPPNFLMRNERDGTFRDVTRQAGLDKNNTRFSFCCAWGDANGDLWPDLYVVNDFGRKNLYKNNRDGTFTDIAREAGVEDVGAGMSACWADFDNDGREDIYVSDMWTAAGIRVSTQENFQTGASPETLEFYRKHSMGNCLFHNSGERFEDGGMRSGTTFGRWSWSSDSWDFDHDGFADLYIANGMISGAAREDLNSFFWRQVVAYSPNEPVPSHEYEQGWNAINELIRSDRSWSGFERNVAYLNNRNGTFSDVSGVAGLDFLEDSRTFALADFDHDGRLEVVLKNRNGPQLRFLRNIIRDLPPSISFRLTGAKSNRDAIGARITLQTDAGAQTRSVQAGTGFLAQHTKEVFFGLGPARKVLQATIQWPSGEKQILRDLPVNHRITVEEGKPPSRVEPFKAPLPQESAGGNSIKPAEILPGQIATWLLIPVPAPEFSLTDQSSTVRTLASLRGKTSLLYFFTETLPESVEALTRIEKHRGQWARGGLQVLAINLDMEQPRPDRPKTAGGPALSFPVVDATADVIATYNLLFRLLFDRHRDMTVPMSFLIDSQGNVVKIYEGPLNAAQISSDLGAIPRNGAERLAKALPFPGLTDSYEFARNYLSLGFVFFQRGYVEQSEGFFRQAVKDDPSSAEAYYGLGSSYLNQRKNQQARECFERCLRLTATYPGTPPNAWNNLGILAAQESETDQAIEDFQHALRIDPKHPIALQNLGNAYRQKRNWPEAQRVLERALALNADDPEANYSLGMVFAQQNDTDKAYQYLQKALAARPAYPEALNNLGILYLRTRRVDQAKQCFEQSIRVAPQYDQSYLNLARVYAIQGDRSAAKSVLEKLLEQIPGHAQAQQELKQLDQ